MIRQLADLRDDVELFELSEEVASALQLADQYTYSNNFIYYQPGNGKVKTIERINLRHLLTLDTYQPSTLTHLRHVLTIERTSLRHVLTLDTC